MTHVGFGTDDPNVGELSLPSRVKNIFYSLISGSAANVADSKNLVTSQQISLGDISPGRVEITETLALSVHLKQLEFCVSPGRSTKTSPLLRMCALRRMLWGLTRAENKLGDVTHLIFLMYGHTAGPSAATPSDVNLTRRSEHSSRDCLVSDLSLANAPRC